MSGKHLYQQLERKFYALQAEYLNTLFAGFFDQRKVFLNHGLFNFGGRTVVFGIGGLDMRTFYNSGHKSTPCCKFVFLLFL